MRNTELHDDKFSNTFNFLCFDMFEGLYDIYFLIHMQFFQKTADGGK